MSNILAQVVQAQFGSNEEYWDYSKTALFDPIGVKTATLETDLAGTWVGSSYLWASVGGLGAAGRIDAQRRPVAGPAGPATPAG